MSEKLKTGDRIRIIIEGTYNEGDIAHVRETGTFGEGRAFEVQSTHNDTVTVELVERPVVTFKRGDVVRSKDVPEFCYALTKDGYTDLFNGLHNISNAEFTSEHYELVDLG